MLIILVGSPPRGHGYSHVAQALGRRLGGVEVKLVRSGRGSLYMEVLRVHTPSLLFVDDPDPKAVSLAIDVLGRTSIGSRGPKAPFDLALTFWDPDKWRRVEKTIGPKALREVDDAADKALITISADDINWGDLEREHAQIHAEQPEA